MKFVFTKKEEQLLIIFLLLHQHKNKVLGFFKNSFHPIVNKLASKSEKIEVPKELTKFIKNYHPCYFVTWLYKGEDQIFRKRESQLLNNFLKNKNLYKLIKINKKDLRKIVLQEEKKWKNGVAIANSAVKKLPFYYPINLILNLFEGFGAGYGIKTNKGNSYVIIGPHQKSLSDQTILHEYMHIVFADWIKTKKGKEFLFTLLKKTLKNKWQKAKRPWYGIKETIAEEYFIRALTLRFLPQNLKPAFLKEQKNQGFRYINELLKWLSQNFTFPD